MQNLHHGSPLRLGRNCSIPIAVLAFSVQVRPIARGTADATAFIMRIKVHDHALAAGAGSLCTTCSHSTIIRGRSVREEIVECHASVMGGRTIPFAVTSCTNYVDARLPSYHAMVHEAWILMPKSKRRLAGFIRGADLTPEDFADVMQHAPDENE